MSTWEGCLDALVTRVIALNLGGLAGTNVRKRKHLAFYESVDTLPLVLALPWGRPTHDRGSSEDEVWVGLPVLLALLYPGNRDPLAGLTGQLTWLEGVTRAAYQAVGDVPGVFDLSVDYQPVLPPAEAQRNWDASAILFHFVWARPRVGA